MTIHSNRPKYVLTLSMYFLMALLALIGAMVAPLSLGLACVVGGAFALTGLLETNKRHDELAYNAKGLLRGVFYSVALYGAGGALLASLVVLPVRLAFSALSASFPHQIAASATFGISVGLAVFVSALVRRARRSGSSLHTTARSGWLWLGLVVFSCGSAGGMWALLKASGVHAQVSSANVRFSVLGVVAISFASVIWQRIHFGFFARRESAANEELSSGVQPMPTTARPFVLIGLDGGDWRVVLPLIEQGKLPALKSLMDRGTYGYLDCHDRTVSPAVWTSIATGKSFEKHGILGFVAPRSSTGRMTPVKSFDRKVKAIWNILSDAGVRVGVLNWMVTFPAEKVNGFMISRLIQIVNEKGGVYPPELEEEIVDLAKRISLKGLDDLDEVARHLQHDLNTLQTLRKLNAELLTRHPVDFYTVYYHGTDEVSHRFFRYAEPERFDPEVWGELEREELDKYSDAVERVWCEADKMLQELIHQCGDWATVMICSDHGSEPYKAPRTCLRLNHVLEKMGYLSFREGSDTEVDLATSRVYWDQQLLCPEEYRIAINTPVIQDPGKLKTTLIQALRTVRIAETNEPLFGSILDAPERYRGICIRSVPASARQEENLHVIIAGEAYPLNNLVRVNNSLSGTHRPTGIFVLSGEGIRRGGVLRRRVFRTPLISFLSPLERRFPTLKRELRALKMSNPYTTLDVTPTILYLLGFPVAQDMDGRVIGEAIDRRWARSYPLRRIVAYPGPDTDGEFLGEDTYESDDLVLERLRGLGYIE